MFTRKTFEAVASTLSRHLDAVSAVQATVGASPTLSASHQTIFDLAEDFATLFANSNPRFDRTKFLSACGFPPTPTKKDDCHTGYEKSCPYGSAPGKSGNLCPCDRCIINRKE